MFQVHLLSTCTIGHFMRFWVQYVALCQDDLPIGHFGLFTH